MIPVSTGFYEVAVSLGLLRLLQKGVIRKEATGPGCRGFRGFGQGF